MTDVLIIGAGAAGLSAAIYACRAGLSATVLEGEAPGGQILNSPDVENYPALEKTTGFDFSMSLLKQAEGFGAKMEYAHVLSARLKGPMKTLVTTEGEFAARTVIIANGAKRRKLGCSGENEFAGKGVSYCATCDGAFFKGKDVAMVGGGNTALEDALFLSSLCNKVYIIHRREGFRAASVLVENVRKRENIQLELSCDVLGISGSASVEGITIRNCDIEGARTLPVSAVFVAIGLEPDNRLFSSEISIDKNGYILAGEDCRTNAAGVFAAGDTRTKQLRQLVTAAADGAVAAFGAANFLNAGGF